MYKTGCQLGQKVLNERRKMAMQPTKNSHPHHKTSDCDTTRRIYAILMVTLQSSSNWESIDVPDMLWNRSVRIEWTTRDSNRADDHLPLFPKNRFVTRAATYMPIQLHPCSLHQIPDRLMYQTGCGMVRRYQMNEKGWRFNRRQHSPPSKKLLCDASRRNSHHLHLDCCCCLPPPPPLFLLLLLLPEVPPPRPASSFVHWVGPSDWHQNNERKGQTASLFPWLLTKISYQWQAVWGRCILLHVYLCRHPTFDEFCTDVVRDALLQQSLYGVVNTSSVEHDAVESRWIERKNWNPY